MKDHAKEQIQEELFGTTFEQITEEILAETFGEAGAEILMAFM